MKTNIRYYEHINELPIGRASDTVLAGCMVLEGGAWRGLYTQGVLDRLMENNINMQTTIGVSAGAMAGMNYVSGQIGRSIRINLTYRHDPDYVGAGAMKNDHGITGFSYLWDSISSGYPLDDEHFYDPKKRFIAVATRLDTAEPVYFEKGSGVDINLAVQASATVPYISKPVLIDGRKYLDGGITDPIPFHFALDNGYQKIIVIRTRDRKYRKDKNTPAGLIRAEYRKYSALKKIMLANTERYNQLTDELDHLEKEGRIFVIAPSLPLDIPRFEGDLDKLAAVYKLGYDDGGEVLPSLKKYLAKQE